MNIQMTRKRGLMLKQLQAAPRSAPCQHLWLQARRCCHQMQGLRPGILSSMIRALAVEAMILMCEDGEVHHSETRVPS
jgi:hypothetical protein